MKSALFLLMGQFDSKTILTLPEICEATGYKLQSAYNDIANGVFTIPIRKQGKRWIADVRDVADWLDAQRIQR